ncbi:MAG: type II toxin-antitoxin system VapC family toxin [Chloroflexi bacterium]|nr:type II toxin-antitoxin system VapC family toxin [Chloroflexota bacterium]
MILLDTQVLLWLRSPDSRLGSRARILADDAWRRGEAAVSAITFWELTMLWAKSRIALPTEAPTFRESLLESGLTEIPLDGEIGIRAGLLADLHGDPADRIIVATAQNGHQLVTTDRRILDWDGPLDRVDARR